MESLYFNSFCVAGFLAGFLSSLTLFLGFDSSARTAVAIEERFGIVKVSVAEVRVEHQVKIVDFMKWLERQGRTPREVSQRHKIRAILGMSVSR
jgi:hypothetical protein